MKKIILLLATLLPCIPATLRSEYPEPVLPIGSDRIESGTVIGPVYSVTDKDGREHTGVTIGTGSYSITIPDSPKEKAIMRGAGGNILPLD